jgi:hypothetical protein
MRADLGRRLVQPRLRIGLPANRLECSRPSGPTYLARQRIPSPSLALGTVRRLPSTRIVFIQRSSTPLRRLRLCIIGVPFAAEGELFHPSVHCALIGKKPVDNVFTHEYFVHYGVHNRLLYSAVVVVVLDGEVVALYVSKAITFLTRALKAPTMRDAVARLAERARAGSWSPVVVCTSSPSTTSGRGRKFVGGYAACAGVCGVSRSSRWRRR